MNDTGTLSMAAASWVTGIGLTTLRSHIDKGWLPAMQEWSGCNWQIEPQALAEYIQAQVERGRLIMYNHSTAMHRLRQIVDYYNDTGRSLNRDSE